MKVYIGKPKSWIGPYQIAEKILFWKDKHEDEIVHKFGEFLAHGFYKRDENDDRLFPKDDEHTTWLYKLCLWIDKKKKQKVKVRIDRHDTWCFEQNLAYIVLPMLKQVKEKKMGAPFTDDADVPKELHSTSAPAKENEWDVDANHFKRWDWILDEMIWAFEQVYDYNDWESQYTTGKPDWRSVKNEKTGHYTLVEGPDSTYKADYEGMKKHQDRILNGFRLFGKYLYNLAD